MTRIYLSALGVSAPGLDDWTSAQAILRDEREYQAEPLKLTAPEILPARERRRSSQSVRLALRAAEEALPGASAQSLKPAAIFSSAYGDPVITHKLCELLSMTPPAASPTLFHNSVHNAPAGYWSMATENPNATTSIATGDQSFASGLLYSAAQVAAEQIPVLLITYDLPYPFPLSEKCQISAPFACALLLTHDAADACIARLDLALGGGPSSTMSSPELESLRRGNPAARALPLLANIAAGDGECSIPCLDGQWLWIKTRNNA
jgi:hypothetical protein